MQAKRQREIDLIMANSDLSLEEKKALRLTYEKRLRETTP